MVTNALKQLKFLKYLKQWLKLVTINPIKLSFKILYRHICVKKRLKKKTERMSNAWHPHK